MKALNSPLNCQSPSIWQRIRLSRMLAFSERQLLYTPALQDLSVVKARQRVVTVERAG